MKPNLRAFTLIETLVCIVIISILTSISVVCYKGAVDRAFLRAFLPDAVRQIKSIQRRANDEKTVIEAEFVEGKSAINLTIKSTPTPRSETMNVSARVGKAEVFYFVFRGYAWPDGTATPRTFTFMPNNSKIEGGTVRIGSAWAEGRIYIQSGNIDWAVD